MPSTVSIFNTGGAVPSSGGSTDGAGSVSSTNSNSDGGEVAAGGGEVGALVVLVLGSPEVDSGTGDTVFSLSAEVEVRTCFGSLGGGGGGGGVGAVGGLWMKYSARCGSFSTWYLVLKLT